MIQKCKRTAILEEKTEFDVECCEHYLISYGGEGGGVKYFWRIIMPASLPCPYTPPPVTVDAQYL
jgi:hypothetical protein